MRVSIVIVNYNVKHYLAQCLHALYRSLEGIDAEVIVVDNASTDGSETYISQLFTQVQYIYNNDNVGFAKANNQAIKIAKGEYILLLNPDTLLSEENIKLVLDFMDEHPNAGACGVKMLSSFGEFLPESKRGYPSPSVSFWRLTGVHRLFPKNKYFDGYYLSYLDQNATHTVPVLAGAYMMLRKSALNKSGLLDEDFFMYGEDIDLSYRITQAGFQNYYLPCPILHYKGESTSKNTYKYVRVFYGAMSIFFEKHSQNYSYISRILVQTGINMQTWIKIGMVYLKRKKQQVVPQKMANQRFLILTSTEKANDIRAILESKEIGEGSLVFNTANELEHYLKNNRSKEVAATHIIYDTSTHTYSEVIKLMEHFSIYSLQAAIYNPFFKNIIAPGEVY